MMRHGPSHRHADALRCALAGALLALAASGPLAARADEAQAHGTASASGRALRVEQPWARATPPGTPVGAGYFTLVNAGRSAVRLVGARSPRAERTQIHRSRERDGTASMRHVKRGVRVAAGERVVFQPGGYHLMLMGLSRRLEPGEVVPVTLLFAQAAPLRMELAVRPIGASGPD